MCVRKKDFRKNQREENFKLELQFGLLLIPRYFGIPSRCRVCGLYQREIVSVLEESFVELPILGVEHAVGGQEAKIALVGFLRSPQDHLPV